MPGGTRSPSASPRFRGPRRKGNSTACAVRTFATPEALVEAVANRWMEETASVANRERSFCVALSGGRIAGRFFDTLALMTTQRGLGLAGVHFFWADERCVAPGHPDSNFAVADRHLFAPLRVSAHQIHRLGGELPPAEAARQGELELRRHTATNGAGVPVLDLILLGMGEDGHVASLFPGAPVETAASVYFPVVGPKPPPQRITLGYAPLAAARQVWVLVSGPGKGTALARSLAPNGRTPLARVIRNREKTEIFTDVRFGPGEAQKDAKNPEEHGCQPPSG